MLLYKARGFQVRGFTMTDGEIAGRTGMSGDTVRPRRGELARRGLIRQTGEKRKTRAGRDAEVWEAVG